jgi:hypothetical protein
MVMAGLDRLDPAISMHSAQPCHANRDRRAKPGDDAEDLDY